MTDRKPQPSSSGMAIALASGLGFIAGMLLFDGNLLIGIGTGLAVGVITVLAISFRKESDG